MRTGTVSYKLEDLRKGVIIPIGMVGENDFTRVIFDAEEVFKKNPDAQVTMKVQPPKGGIYPATVTRDGNTVTWQVKAADVAHRGSGELQLTFTADTMVEKSYIAKTDIKRSLVGNGPAPDPIQDFVDNANEKLAEVDQALDDLAAMDNIAKTAQASDIGKALSPKTVENGVVTEWEYIIPGGGTEDYTDLENKPKIGGVELDGNKSLSDLGIASADDLDDLEDEVSDVKTAIHGLDDIIEEQFGEPEKTIVPAFDIVSGKFIDTDGTETSAVKWSCSDFVDISEAKDRTVIITSTIYGNYATLAWYNESKEFIGGINGSNCSEYGITQSWLIKTHTITIPAEAKYIRCNVFLDYATESDLKIQYTKAASGGLVEEELGEKLDINQDSTNAGKILVVGNNGDVIPVSAPWSDDVANKADKITQDIVGSPKYVNLLDQSKLTENTYIVGTTGLRASSNYYDSTDFILLKAHTRYYVGMLYIGVNTHYHAFYTQANEASFTASADITMRKDNTYHCVIDVGANDVYARFSKEKYRTNPYVSAYADYYVPYPTLITLEKMLAPMSRFRKVLVIGDSISSDAYGNYNKWVTDLIEEGFFPTDTNNNSQHATGFVKRYDNLENDFISRIKAVQNPETYDLVVVFGGINDANALIPVGTDSDTDYETYFKPALKEFYRYTCASFINARIAVLLPLPCSTQNRDASLIGVQYTYSNLQKEVAEAYSLPILDLTNKSGFYVDANREGVDYATAQAFRNKWTLVVGSYDPDGAHPTEEYERKFLAPMIKKFIDSL